MYVVGKAAYEFGRETEQIVDGLSALCRVPPAQLADRVTGLLEEIKTLKKQAKERRPETGARTSAEDLLAAARQVSGAAVVIQAVENVNADEMRQLIDVMRRKHETGLAVLLAVANDGKVQLAAGFSKDLIDRGLLEDTVVYLGGEFGRSPKVGQSFGTGASPNGRDHYPGCFVGVLAVAYFFAAPLLAS